MHHFANLVLFCIFCIVIWCNPTF